MQGARRHVKGSNVIDLVKFAKRLAKSVALPALSPAAGRLMEERLLPSGWYALEPFAELLSAVDTAILEGDEERALGLGITAGLAALDGPARLYVKPRDPVGTVLAMRHAWRARHDFGVLAARLDGEGAVLFELTEYADINMVHALTTAGWGVAGARAVGAAASRVEVLERPWRGGTCFRYRIIVRS